MLRQPKTLSKAATVAEVRAQLANPKVQMVILAEDGTFVGAVTSVPADAAAHEQAVRYADADAETIRPTEPAAAAFERAAANPHRRVIVVDDFGHLHGLLCLDPSRTRFCQTPSSAA